MSSKILFQNFFHSLKNISKPKKVRQIDHLRIELENAENLIKNSFSFTKNCGFIENFSEIIDNVSELKSDNSIREIS